MNRRLPAVLSGCALSLALSLAALSAVAAPNAAAASAKLVRGVSANWSGYAATRTTYSDKFKRVAGSWTQPEGQCTRGTSTYSAIWVGLGGYENGAQALEQTGSEVDCTASGEAVYSAWFELVPAGPVALRLAVHPGDRINASVAVSGKRVVMQVKDLTTGRARTVLRRMRNPRPDLTSAEWIVEAPSACSVSNACRTLPLTNFGSVAFSNASATTMQGARTPISSGGYEVTALELRDSAPDRQAGRGHEAAVLAGANPSELLSGGTAFNVAWQQLSSGQAQEAEEEAAEEPAGEVGEGEAEGAEGPYSPPGLPYGRVFRR